MRRDWKLWGISCAVALFSASVAQSDEFNPTLQQRRMQVWSAVQKGTAGLPALTAALQDSNPLVRRAAINALEQIGPAAAPLLKNVVKNDRDDLTRRSALRLWAGLERKEPLPLLEEALADPSEMVRSGAVELLVGMRPYTPAVTGLLARAQSDKSATVSRIASQALWPFQQDGVSLRELPRFKDLQLTTLQTIPLPEKGWRFQTDAAQTGHHTHWYQTDFNDSAWPLINIGQTWEKQTGTEYDGVAWYRHSFTLPAKPEQDGTDLVFEAVDESAWVWLNGHYIGQHDIGPDGWDLRFAMDVTDALKWGQPNQITIRVLDRAQGGGIWKPVYLEVLKR